MQIIKPYAMTYARIIKAVAFDVDGVMTDNRVWDGLPYKVKIRSYYDGQGISLLRAIGLRVCFVTADADESAEPIRQAVEKWNNLPSSWRPENPQGWSLISLFSGRHGEGKVEAVDVWLQSHGLTWKQCAAMGDDLVDLPLLKKVILPAAPAQAERVAKDNALFISEREGGHGAVRDFVNFILQVRDIDPTKLPTK
ncbi:MAG: HAD hydrolase family protein [bacterium]|nr:HAD hydrolase family protein [bacterium]